MVNQAFPHNAGKRVNQHNLSRKQSRNVFTKRLHSSFDRVISLLGI